MNSKMLAVGIVFLFIIASATPMVIGYTSDNYVSSESEELLDNLAFMCYDERGNNAKYEYYKEHLLNDYSNDEVEIAEVVEPVESSTAASFGGPMDSPWSMVCHDTHHTGRSQYSTANNPDGIEKWRFLEDRWIDVGPVIDNDGTIYFGDVWGDLIAIYPDGTLKWKYTLDGQIIGSTPALSDDGTIYVGSWDAGLYAINPNGTLKWRYGSGASIFSSPAIDEDGTIYFGNLLGGSGYRIYAVNPDGTEKWHYTTGDRIYSDPAIGSDGTIYIGSDDTYLYALYHNGSLRWRFKTESYVKGPLSVADDGTIYVGSYDGYLYAVYPNGTMRWKCAVGSGTATNPSIASDGTIYVGGRDLYAVYPNGTMRWVFDLGNRHIDASSPAICDDGIIYVGTEIGEGAGGEIIAINSDGAERWRKRIANQWIESSPSIGEDGTVYIGSSAEMGKGYLHAFGSVESNNPPNKPTIDGPTEGKIEIEYDYQISSIDPDNNPVSFYIDWGDDTPLEWSMDFASGEIVKFGHTWEEEGTYTIGVKSRDTLGEESDWVYLEVTMPVNQQSTHPMFYWFLERFPNAFPILRNLIEAQY